MLNVSDSQYQHMYALWKATKVEYSFYLFDSNIAGFKRQWTVVSLTADIESGHTIHVNIALIFCINRCLLFCARLSIEVLELCSLLGHIWYITVSAVNPIAKSVHKICFHFHYCCENCWKHLIATLFTRIWVFFQTFLKNFRSDWSLSESQTK